jgi:anaerobic selenocysteine-containing dehydrogenase
LRDNDMQSGVKEEKVVNTFCALCGPKGYCGIKCHVKDGRLVGIEGMENSPTNHGKLCPKAYASVQWLYSPQRLKYPMKRIGEKGEGKFTHISWDEALDIIANKLKEQKEKYGPESLAILSSQFRSYTDYYLRFLAVHGSPNFGHSGICSMQRSFGFAHTIGMRQPSPDIENSDLIVIWGANPVHSSMPMGNLKKILDAKDRGARLMVIKPAMQPDAAKADIWVPIRPGTDGALALAVLNVIINDNLYDKDFVDKWCYGFEKLVPHIQKYTPTWAEQITGIPAERIREIAHVYAEAKTVSTMIGNAFDQMPDSSNAVRSIAILIAITGNIDRPGGNVMPMGSDMPSPKEVMLRKRYSREMIDKLVGPEFPPNFQPFVHGLHSAYYRCLDSVLTEEPYPVKTIIAAGIQPTVITRNSPRIIKSLEKLDFFVVIDVMENAAMPWADVVIPVASMYECDHPFETFAKGKQHWIMARSKVIEPLGDYKSDFQFWLDLAVKMGYGGDFWNGDIDQCMNDLLQNFGITIDELRQHPEGIVYDSKPMVYEKYDKIFSIPSLRLSKAPFLPQKKAAIYNTTFEENGFSPLPEYKAPPESIDGTPELLDKYPLIFFDTHTTDVYHHGWLRNIPCLREMRPDPCIYIHPETAEQRGIENGEWVIVESPHGWIKVKAEYFLGIRPDTIMGLHGWWQGCEELDLPGYPLENGGANVNVLYSSDYEKAFDPMVTAMSKQTLVQVRKSVDE